MEDARAQGEEDKEVVVVHDISITKQSTTTKLYDNYRYNCS
jgi:hypothetical protein